MDFLRRGPTLRDGDEVVLEPPKVPIEPVDRRGLEQQEVGRDSFVAGPRMEAGLIGDDHVQRVRIAGGDLLEEDGVDVLVDGPGEEQMAVVRTVDLQRFMQVAPLVRGGVGGMDTRITKRPDPADDLQQSITLFVENPEAHGLVGTLADHSGQAVGKLGAKGVGSGSMHFVAAFARHLELAAQAVDELAHVSFGELCAGAFLNPFLRVARLAEFHGLEFLDEFHGEFPVNGQRARAGPIAFEKGFEALSDQLVAIGENDLTRHAGDLDDLGDGVVVLGDDPHR